MQSRKHALNSNKRHYFTRTPGERSTSCAVSVMQEGCLDHKKMIRTMGKNNQNMYVDR